MLFSQTCDLTPRTNPRINVPPESFESWQQEQQQAGTIPDIWTRMLATPPKDPDLLLMLTAAQLYLASYRPATADKLHRRLTFILCHNQTGLLPRILDDTLALIASDREAAINHGTVTHHN